MAPAAVTISMLTMLLFRAASRAVSDLLVHSLRVTAHRGFAGKLDVSQGMDDYAVSLPPERPGEGRAAERAGGVDRAGGGADCGAGRVALPAAEDLEEFGPSPRYCSPGWLQVAGVGSKVLLRS
jgi:hypothetical protein